MAKIDDRIANIQKDFQDPQVSFGTTWVEDSQMESLGIRRKSAGQPKHKLCFLTVADPSLAQPATFWGHKFTEVLVKAEKWRGVYTKSGRGRKPKVA